MNKTSIGTKVPTANIAVNKSRMKIYNKSGEIPTYYLQKGQEFQIELFNPTTNVVLAKIELNGKLISQSGLILNPGERVFLDRYIDVPQKFLFDTYEVSNTEEVKEAIKNNGDIKVYFYQEEEMLDFIIPIRSIIRNYPPYPTITPTPYWYCGTSTSSDFNLTANNTVTNDTLINTATYFSSSVGEELKSFKNTKRSKKLETGRVEQGSHSNQNFTYVNKNFNSLAFHTVEYKLLPISQKTITIDELMVKRYCTNCGSKVGKTDKFCSKCGTKI